MTQVDADMTDAQEHPGHPAVDAQQENAATGKEAPATGTPSSLAVKSAMVRRLGGGQGCGFQTACGQVPAQRKVINALFYHIL